MTSKLDRWKQISAVSKVGKTENESSPNKNKPELIQQLSRVPDDDNDHTKNKELVDSKDEKELSEPEPPEDGQKGDTHYIEETHLSGEGETGVNNNNNNINNIPDSGIQNRNTKQEYSLKIQNINNTPAENLTGVGQEEYKNDSNPTETFVNRVNQGLRDTLSKKITKDKTHTRTTLLLKNELLNKLANFDAAMGGRIQGLFLNDLLENFFDELEQQDERWKKVLNKKTR